MKGQHFLRLYQDLWNLGHRVKIKQDQCIELVNYEMVIRDPTDCLTSFAPRKLNLAYCKAEWLWYLRGDRFDQSIETHATMWKKLRQPDGGYNSNYGQYIFGQKQFDWVIECLVNDPSSRQACMQLLNVTHMYAGNTDVVCTMGIQFLIRNERLDMFVRMRSNDAIYGMTNDVFCFSQLHQMVKAGLLLSGLDVQLGKYHHSVGSLHVYERHFPMLQELASGLSQDYQSIDIPAPVSYLDFAYLRDNPKANASQSEYVQWMLS